MKNYLYRLISCGLLIIAAVTSTYAADGIIETRNYTMCPGDTIQLSTKEVVVSEATTLYDTLHGKSPEEDSIYVYIVTMLPRFEKDEYKRLQQGESFVWHGKTITAPGIYEQVYHTTSDERCDSIYRLHVTQLVDSAVTFTLCEGEQVIFHGRTYSNAGVYQDMVREDTVFTITIVKHPSYAVSERVTFYSFPQTYRGQVIDAPGTYAFPYRTAFGCDSTVTAYIDLDVYIDEQSATICPGDTYIWSYDGETYTVGGKYTKTEKDMQGKDSVLHILNLRVNNIPETYIEHTMCKGNQYSFGEETLTQSGVYRHTFYNQEGGCDSAVVLSLNVLNPDTTYLAIQRNEGESYIWDGETISTPGIYFHYGTNRFGCDSVSILHFTYNQVDTVYGSFTVCPNELPFEWHGISGYQTKRYSSVQEEGGKYINYILDLTVREAAQTETTLSICAGGSITYNGVMYTEAGHYRSWLNCDTLVNVHVIVNQPVVYETRGSLGGSHGYTWTYKTNGVEKTTVFNAPGTYEYESANPETGCNDLYRLILTKDETSYLFEEYLTICEGEDFEWHSLSNLSGIPGTSTYTDAYMTRNGEDSIYTLHLTVIPTERTVRTITFCGETSWNGKTYTNSAVIYDTIAQQTGCYRIERINLDKVSSFYSKESKELPQGTVLLWHGQTITTDGTYYDYGTTVNGCDSTYEITVTIIPASPQTNQYAEEISTCEGDTIEWRGKPLWRSGVYVDTVYAAGTNQIDSIFSLTFTVWPAPKDTIYQHLYTCSAGAGIRYNGKDYYSDETIVTKFNTIHGCDSIVKAYLHFNTALTLRRTDTITDMQLPYKWTYQLYEDAKRDTTLTTSGTYTHTVSAEGGCTSEEELVLVVLKTYLYELDTTVCETRLPFVWRGQSLQHTIGETKQYEDVLKTVHNTDSIYRLHLTIEAAPRTIERYDICENKDTIIYGKSYYNSALYPVGTVIRDTVLRHNAGTICDSIIYIEINKIPQRHMIEERIKHLEDTIIWREDTITAHTTRTYKQEGEIDAATGCEMIYELLVIAEDRKEVTICKIDTAEDTHPDKKYPYVWEQTGKEYTTTGIYTDTIFDQTTGHVLEFYSLYLTITQPYDTTVYLHSCEPDGVVWRNQAFNQDTVFVDRVEVDPFNPEQPCDTVYHVHVTIDRTYYTYVDTTLCEYQLPLIVGRVNPDTIWEEKNFRHEGDVTIYGCDSIIEGHLTIIPKLEKNDSTFICEGDFVTLGDTVHPAFLEHDGDKWAEIWRGNWKGVRYTEDTIVWDCDHRYFHHIIRRPTQKIIPEKTFYLCHDDSLQLFWPYDSTWFSHDTTYLEVRPMDSIWTDPIHGITYKNDAYTCDSVTRWFIKKLPHYYKDTTAHRLLGDSIWWGNKWRYYTGTYDSIAQSPDTNSLGKTCTYTYRLHLIMDTAYYFRDTISLCTPKYKTHAHVWSETGYKQSFTVGSTDTTYRHYIDSLTTYDRRDSIYDLCVHYSIIRDTLLFDTICEGNSYRFDTGHGKIERWVNKPDRYVDTLRAINGCDSIVTLQLYVRPGYPTSHKEIDINVRDTPYAWVHTWVDAQQLQRDTDYISIAGEYVKRLASIHGCDSIDSLTLRIHDNYVFYDSISICADETPYTWYGPDGTVYKSDIYETGEHIRRWQTANGFGDSTRILRIEVKPILRSLRYDTLCYGDSLLFGLTKAHQPRYLHQSGVYYDTLQSAQYGCDSIVEIRLNVFGHYLHSETRHIMRTDTPYVWYHYRDGSTVASDSTILHGEGSYAYNFFTSHGCDSIDSLTLVLHDDYLYRDSVIICQDEVPYTWYGADGTVYKNGIYETGDYIYHLRKQDGYSDSTLVRRVTMLPVKVTLIHDSICADVNGNNFYTFAGQNLNQGGVYRDTLTAANGCDSIVELHLTVNRPYYSFREEHIVEGQEVIAYGQTFRMDTVYTHSSLTPNGCDSTVVLKVVVHPMVDTVVTVCSSDLPYIWINKWNGQPTPLYTAGLYRNDTTMVGDQRMFYGLRLIVIQPSETTIYREICEGGFYNFNGQNLSEAGEYHDTIKNTSGCDSVIILHLNVLSKYYHMVEHTIYEGDSMLFEGQYYKESGAYPIRFTSSYGCDSVMELRLTVTRLFDDSISVCANDLPYVWHGKTIYESGIYRDTVVNTEGKESVIGIKVTVLPISRAAEPLQVSICEGDFYKFGERILTEQGTYYDTLTAVNGCDSITMLALQVMPANYQATTQRIFEGDSALFNGVWYKESGVYEYRELNENGCTVTYQLILTVLKTYNIDTTAVICANELPYIWRGYEFNESGEYTLPIAWTDSSRVVKTLHLTVNSTFYVEQNIHICAGDTFLFKGKKYFESGSFYDTIPANTGCDSIKKYILSMHPTYDRIFEKHISDKQPYVFHNRELSQTGTYEWTGKTIHGCDSMEHLILTVHPSFFHSDTIDICQSDSANYPYVWQDVNGRIIATISQSGIYNDSVLTDYGFDSVHQLVVYVHPSYLIREQYEIGDGEILKIHGRNISEPAIYYDTLRSVYGCDSIYHIVVNQKRTREFTWNKTICQGDAFEFLDGRLLTKTGQYKYVSPYKDSIVYLNLTVNPTTYSEKRVVITDKSTSYIGTDGQTYYSYIYEGKLYDELRLGNNLISEQYINQYGCDSIARLIIVVTTRYSDWTPLPLCPGSEIKIDGQVITEAGLYSFERRSKVTGEMDSLYRVEVYDAPAYEFDENRTICDGDTLYYGNKIVTRGGKQDVVLKTQEGCDSIYHLNITVNPSYRFDTTVTIVDYQTYTWYQNHQTYNEEGRYEKSFPTIEDCDSTYVLNLRVIPTIRQGWEYTICDGQEYTWRGKTYTQEGLYHDTVLDIAASRSAIYSLDLTVAHPTYIASAKAAAICADDRAFSIEFTYTGAKPTTYSIYYDQLAKDEGFKDVINKPFLGEDKFASDSVPQKAEVVYMDHTTYVKPNKYTMSLVLDNGVCGISRADNIELLIKYPSWIIEQNWNDIVVPLKKELNGGYEFNQMEWFVNGIRQPNNGKGYLEHNFHDGDEVILSASRKGENYAIESCPLTIRINPNIAYDDPILVYPTQAPRHTPVITIKAPQGGQFAIYSSTGSLLSEGQLDEGSTQITLPSVCGIYFIRTNQGKQAETHKVLLY